MRVNFIITDDTIISRISLLTTSQFKMKKIIGWIMLAKEIRTKQIIKPKADNLGKIMNVELLEKGANSIVKMVQLKSFGEEVRVLSANSDSRVEAINQATSIILTLSCIMMVCYELVVDWGNSDFLTVKLILWFFQNKATYQEKSYNGTMTVLPIVE